MVKPSKGAAIFLLFFGLMFFVPGLLSLFAFLARSPGQPAAGTIAAAAISLFFIAVGGGLVLAALFGYRKMQAQAALEESNPGSPWLWRKDWAVRRADSQKKNNEIGAWILCLLGNLFVLPFAVAMVPALARQMDPRALIVLAICSIGPILLVRAVRASLRHRRFGDTWFELYSLPFSPGANLSGRIHLQLDASAEHGINLHLSCVRKTVTGSGNNRSTVQTVLWQAEQCVSSGTLGMEPAGRTIPVDIAIPPNAYVTDQDNSSDQVLWLLHAEADLPGLNYSDDFEVPVFRTAASPRASSPSDSASFGFASSASGDDSAAVAAPSNPKVVISSQSGGTEFYFPAFRTPSRALFLLLFTVVWSGIVFFLFRSNAPWFFPFFFGLMDLLLVLACFHSLFGTVGIRVGNGELVSTKKILGIGNAKRFSLAQIDSVLPVTSGQTTTNQGTAQYAIRLLTKDDKRFTLADEISSRQEARWVVSQIESLAGLKLDTHVEVTAPFGAPQQPPQPFQPMFGAGLGASLQPQAGRSPSRKQSPKATLVSFAVFALVAGGMFAYQGRRFANFKSQAASRSNRSRPNQLGTVSMARPLTKPVATAQPPAPMHAMTDAEAEQILALPAQAQAEELLERAIGHDPKALELFEQNVESWIGHIRLTDRMRQLETRSQYSNDLRVRYANADIFLTLDGWHKDEQAADMLIERAKTDLHYRAAAVFFLGMLAGRGVAYDKIHPVLLDYVKHDSDPSVRQWAVEGMRYVGKNEALDELWESFTQDPSMAVRNRAGCNISDCGNFTRRQRMRMVPKFLELLGNPNLDPQMRGWCFLALHEITDENVPSDVQAWRNWYGQRGAGKLAEIERLEWWQVRGDE